MNYELERIRPSHFDEIKGQASQAYFGTLLEQHPEYKEMICKQSTGRAARLDGVIIAICGITKVTEYMGEGWAYFAEDLPKGAKSVIRDIKAFIHAQKQYRII